MMMMKKKKKRLDDMVLVSIFLWPVATLPSLAVSPPHRGGGGGRVVSSDDTRSYTSRRISDRKVAHAEQVNGGETGEIWHSRLGVFYFGSETHQIKQKKKNDATKAPTK